MGNERLLENIVAISPVGGGGTRLYPLTCDIPKPLVSMVCSTPLGLILEHAIRQGIREFYLVPSTYEISLRIHDYFKTGEGISGRLGLKRPAELHYIPRNIDRGDGDAFFKGYSYYKGEIGDKLVLYLNGDNITSIGFESMLKRQQETQADIVLAVKKEEDSLQQFGTVAFDIESYDVLNFLEKSAEPASNYIYTGIGLFSPGFFRKAQEKMQDIFHRQKIGMSRDIIMEFMQRKLGRAVVYDTRGRWSDVGTPTAFLATTEDILHGQYKGIDFGPYYEHLSEEGLRREFHVHKTTYERIKNRIGSDIRLEGVGIIGADCEIGHNVKIQNSAIGHHCSIGDGSVIVESSIAKLTAVGKETNARGTIVGVFCDIGQNKGNVVLRSGSVIGNNVVLQPGSVIKNDQRVAAADYKQSIEKASYLIEGEDSENVYFRK